MSDKRDFVPRRLKVKCASVWHINPYQVLPLLLLLTILLCFFIPLDPYFFLLSFCVPRFCHIWIFCLYSNPRNLHRSNMPCPAQDERKGRTERDLSKWGFTPEC